MPIIEMDLDASPPAVTQLCRNCGARREINFADLKLGAILVGEGGMSSLNTIRLPDCQCGAVEFLMRSPSSEMGDHHVVVNYLAAKLKAQGQLEPALAERFATEVVGPLPATSLPLRLLNIRKDLGV